MTIRRIVGIEDRHLVSAHFHLNKGTRVEQLNWLADLSSRGLKQSNGIMLNYLYDIKTIDVNHELYRARQS